jgi:hypothetical protein
MPAIEIVTVKFNFGREIVIKHAINADIFCEARTNTTPKLAAAAPNVNQNTTLNAPC